MDRALWMTRVARGRLGPSGQIPGPGPVVDDDGPWTWLIVLKTAPAALFAEGANSKADARALLSPSHPAHSTLAYQPAGMCMAGTHPAARMEITSARCHSRSLARWPQERRWLMGASAMQCQ